MSEPTHSRYIVGIDLGTTNCAVSYCDTHAGRRVQSFPIRQRTEHGTIETRPVLPSFCYLESVQECIVGEWAREQGALVPTRQVSSAKSWLCHAGASRRDRLLPTLAEESLRISPVEASRRYLDHLREAWNATLGDLESQEIILTVPASFDEVARALTVQAATEAGLQHLTLVEEPQAAFYQWISRHEEKWKSQIPPGSLILICDVGGGTSDFTLIEAREEGFKRHCVGDHLLLGGDNMDAALAHVLEKKLGRELEPYQWHQLLAQARQAKEKLLSTEQAECAIRIQPRGASLVAGTLSTQITREELHHVLMDSFFSRNEKSAALTLKTRSGGQSAGLPYEEDSSITKQLAHFLFTLARSERAPDFVLFNGGSMKPVQFQKAIIESIGDWYQKTPPGQLFSDSLDLAVARGAAYYGLVRRGEGSRISGGTARAYYLQVEAQGTAQAVTLLPRGSEEGVKVELDLPLTALPNQPVSFQLFSSHTRLNDLAGEMISIKEEELHPLPPLQTVLHYGKGHTEPLPVHIGIYLTPVGTLQVWLQAVQTDHRWNLEFQVRGTEGQESVGKQRIDETRDERYLEAAKEVVREAFKSSTIKVMDALETALQQPRKQWAFSTLRGLFDEAIRCAETRNDRWWNLIGFALRPGFGYPLDDFRIKQLWKMILSDAKTSQDPLQKWICFRRIAGGLNKGQQQQIAAELLQGLESRQRNSTETYLYTEKMRCLASLELLEHAVKRKLGEFLLKRIGQGQAEEVDFWSLARVGARHLLHGGPAHVLPAETCQQWLEKLLSLEDPPKQKLLFVYEQLARKTAERHLNISPGIVAQILTQYNDPRITTLLSEVVAPNQGEEEQVFGETLPIGLKLYYAVRNE